MEVRVRIDSQSLADHWGEILMVSPPPIPEPYTNHPSLYYILIFCNNFVIPVIIFIGIVGNILAFFVFVFSSLKRMPTSVYLAALAFADCSFLVCLGAGWLDNFRFSFFQQEMVCTFVVYMTYVFSFLSVWFVVCFTTDMYLTLFHEYLAVRINCVSKARFVVCGLTLLCGVLYLHTFWTTKQVKTGDDQETCVFVADEDVRIALALADSFLTLLLPYTLLIFMNIRILLVITGFSRRRRRRRQRGDHIKGRAGASSSPSELRLEPIEEVEESEIGLRLAAPATCSALDDDASQPVTQEVTSVLTEAPDLPSTKRNSEDNNNSGPRRCSRTKGSHKSSTPQKEVITSPNRNDVTQKRRDFDDDQTCMTTLWASHT